MNDRSTGSFITFISDGNAVALDPVRAGTALPTFIE